MAEVAPDWIVRTRLCEKETVVRPVLQMWLLSPENPEAHPTGTIDPRKTTAFACGVCLLDSREGYLEVV
jgi:hypothetical protein